jgi:hypothetical protein
MGDFPWLQIAKIKSIDFLLFIDKFEKWVENLPLICLQFKGFVVRILNNLMVRLAYQPNLFSERAAIEEIQNPGRYLRFEVFLIVF